MTRVDGAELDLAAYLRWHQQRWSKAHVAAMMSRAHLTDLERLVIARHFYDNTSFREIARQLRCEGIAYPGRGNWYPMAIHRICHRAIVKLRAVAERIAQ